MLCWGKDMDIDIGHHVKMENFRPKKHQMHSNRNHVQARINAINGKYRWSMVKEESLS